MCAQSLHSNPHCFHFITLQLIFLKPFPKDKLLQVIYHLVVQNVSEPIQGIIWGSLVSRYCRKRKKGVSQLIVLNKIIFYSRYMYIIKYNHSDLALLCTYDTQGGTHFTFGERIQFFSNLCNITGTF